MRTEEGAAYQKVMGIFDTCSTDTFIGGCVGKIVPFYDNVSALGQLLVEKYVSIVDYEYWM